jgi:hypothetical protein
MSDPVFVGISLEEAKDAIRELYRERDQIKKELSDALLQVRAMREIVDAAKDYFQKHYIEGGYVGSNIPTVERLAKALEAYTERRSCSGHIGKDNELCLKCGKIIR